MSLIKMLSAKLGSFNRNDRYVFITFIYKRFLHVGRFQYFHRLALGALTENRLGNAIPNQKYTQHENHVAPPSNNACSKLLCIIREFLQFADGEPLHLLHM